MSDDKPNVFAGFDKPGYDTANVAVISKETHNTASQMGGAQTDQEQFNNVNVWYNNSWQPFGLTNRIQEDQPYYNTSESPGRRAP